MTGDSLDRPEVRDCTDSELQRNEEIIADCIEALRRNPHNVELYLERGNALFSLGRNEAAVADFDRATSLDLGNATAYFGRCRARSELGRHEEAIEDYDELMRLAPEGAATFETR